MEFFKAEKLTPTTTWIVDQTQVYCYLVEGRDRAALIDTGTGLGNLKAFVSALTPKPLTVILTHGHGDHASAAALFDEVWLHPADWELVTAHDTMEMKTGYARGIMGPDYARVSEADFVRPRTAPYLPLSHGQTFDLGGVTLEAVSLPGHTRGMTAILNREERTILLGDACNTYVYLWLEESTSVEGYRQNLLRLKKREGDYDSIYLSHGPRVVEKALVDSVIAVCDDILAGKSDEAPFQVPPFAAGRTAFAAKAIRPDGPPQRLDGGLGNIVYNPDRIFS